MGFMSQFQQQTPTPQQSIINNFNSVKQAANGNASALIEYMKQTNSDFAAFANSMQGKTPEQAFKEFGLDYSQFKGIL